MKQSLPWERFICGTFLIVCLGGAPVLAADDLEKDMRVQVMLGAASFSHMNLDHQSTTDPSVEADDEISWMPMLGVCGSIPLRKDTVTFGLEGGALVGWKSDSVNAFAGPGNTIRVHIENELALGDLFFGPYMSTDLGQHARFYLGAGPLFMVGQYDKHSDEFQGDLQTASDHEISTANGFGLYARTGIEFKFKDNSWMGLGVRGFKSKLDFDNVSGTTDVKGLQFLISYTLGI